MPTTVIARDQRQVLLEDARRGHGEHAGFRYGASLVSGMFIAAALPDPASAVAFVTAAALIAMNGAQRLLGMQTIAGRMADMLRKGVTT